MQRYGSSRSVIASLAREQRAEQRRLRELEKAAKALLKQTNLERAQAEVEGHEQVFNALVSHHKVCVPVVDWPTLAYALMPAETAAPPSTARRAWRMARISEPQKLAPDEPPPLQKDDLEAPSFRHSEDCKAWQQNKALAERVLRGDEVAFIEALNEFSSLDEVSSLGSTIEITAFPYRRLEATFRSNDEAIIPTETKTLTASGTVSTKNLPRARFREIYQDHVCSGMLRIARELFAVLPIEQLLLTTFAHVDDSTTGKIESAPIYSVKLRQQDLDGRNYDRIDPSDTIESFPHRGDFSASRKQGSFEKIEPFTFEGFDSTAPVASIEHLREKAKTLCEIFSGFLVGSERPSSKPAL